MSMVKAEMESRSLRSAVVHQEVGFLASPFDRGKTFTHWCHVSANVAQVDIVCYLIILAFVDWVLYSPPCVFASKPPWKEPW